MSRYEIIIYWSDEDQEFIAEVPGLPGCMAHGATHQEVMSLWLDNAEKVGRNIPQPLGHRLAYA